MAGEMPPAPALWLQPGLWVRTRPPPPPGEARKKARTFAGPSLDPQQVIGL